MALEIDVFQTGGNVKVLHLELDYFALMFLLQEVFSANQLSTSEDV